MHELPKGAARVIHDQHRVIARKYSQRKSGLVGAVDGKAGRRADGDHHGATCPDRLLHKFLTAPSGHQHKPGVWRYAVSRQCANQLVQRIVSTDVFARYQVRVEEMRQSALIVRQAMEGMPEGKFTADAPHVTLPEREKMKTQMEALIFHFKIVTEGFRVPEGEVYQVIESPRGEVGYYMVSDGTAKPYRVHVRGPSFGNLQAVPTMVQGTLIADVIAAIGSMDFVLGDTDR